MFIPPLKTTIDRRILINYRVDPEVLKPHLQDPTAELRLIQGKAVAGICLIRLTDLRPAFIRPRMGLAAENAAHRFGVEYHRPDGSTETAVYIPERHTTSWMAKLAGGVVFPGKHHHASFEVLEGSGEYQVAMHAKGNHIEVGAHVTAAWDSQLFPRPEDASAFFRDSPVGYSPNPYHAGTDAIELVTPVWRTSPLKVTYLRSSFYDSLPAGSVEFDDALLMEDIQASWRKPITA